MKRRLRRKLFIGIAVAAVLAGVTAAVVMAAEPSKHHHHQHAHHARQAGIVSGARSAQRGALAGAAAYLGVSATHLRSELKTGKSLAEIANATSGKSEAGLVAALEASEKAQLAAASASLPRRVAAEVNRVHGDGMRAAARRYLGIHAAQLRGDLRSGKTLAAIAGSTNGKSEAGLIAALVAARQATLAAEVASGRITQAQANALLPKLSSREAARVKRVRAGRRARAPKG